MNKTIVCAVFAVVLNAVMSVQAQDPIPLASAGGITMFAVPNDAPSEGLYSNKIVLKADNDAARIVTFENINIANAHQVWSSLDFSEAKTFFAPTDGALYDSDWIPFDTHLLIPESDIAGGVVRFVEPTTDRSTDLGFPQLPVASVPVSGFGPTKTAQPTDAFFLKNDAQRNEIDFAQVVSSSFTPATITVGVLGEGFTNSGERDGAFFDAISIAVNGDVPTFCDSSAAQFCFDFSSSPTDNGAILGGDAEWRGTGGVDDGYLKITDAANGQRGVAVIPISDTDFSFVFGGRTGGANSAHHIDNLEATLADGRVNISAMLRVGGGTDRPADGFSFNFVPNSDPTTAGDTNGWAGIGGEPENLPEEGTVSGLSIGFDEWQSGPAPESNADFRGPNARDVVGISLRVDGEIVCQASLPTLNGALEDTTSLQTGPNDRGLEGLGWAQLTIDASVQDLSDFELHDISVTWKNHPVSGLACIPEPSTGAMALLPLVLLGVLRRKHVARN